MTMEKYSVDVDTLTLDLQNEEGQIMTQISAALSNPLHDANELAGLEKRRTDIRNKIEELRSKKAEENRE